MMMHDPAHPGVYLREAYLDPLDISVSTAAERLGMSRVALSRVLNGRAAVSPNLAVRLERAGVSKADFWLAMQAQYDLAQALKQDYPPVQPIQTKAA